MNTVFRFICREWFAIILLGVLAYAVWGDHGQKEKDVETYAKGGVIIALVSDVEQGALIDALENDRWIHNGRARDACYEFVVFFDEQDGMSGMYSVLGGPDKKRRLVYSSDPEDVFDWLKLVERELGCKKSAWM